MIATDVNKTKHSDCWQKLSGLSGGNRAQLWAKNVKKKKQICLCFFPPFSVVMEWQWWENMFPVISQILLGKPKGSAAPSETYACKKNIQAFTFTPLDGNLYYSFLPTSPSALLCFLCLPHIDKMHTQDPTPSMSCRLTLKLKINRGFVTHASPALKGQQVLLCYVWLLRHAWRGACLQECRWQIVQQWKFSL